MATQESILGKYRMLQHLMMQSRPSPRPHETFSDTTQGQGRVLALLKLKDGLSTKELSRILNVRVSSLNETLAKLERAGMVDRRPSEHDRRVMLAYLTEKGRSHEQDRPSEIIDMLDGFSAEELDVLESFLDRIIANLEKSLGPDQIKLFNERMQAREAFFKEFGEAGGLPQIDPPRPPAPPRPPEHPGHRDPMNGVEGFDGFPHRRNFPMSF